MGIVAMMSAIFATANLPEPEKIRSTAEEVVGRSEFQLRPTHDSKALWDIIWSLLEPIFKFFGRLWDISPVLAWTVIVGLILLATLIVTHIIYSIRKAVARRQSLSAEIKFESRKTDPDELERQSEDAAARNDYITAVRLLFRAALLRIARGEQRELRPGTTNREYLRRYGQSPFAGSLRQFVDVIDAKWYGGGVCDASDYQSCRHAHTTICAAI
jgi:hypothetical protein